MIAVQIDVRVTDEDGPDWSAVWSGQLDYLPPRGMVLSAPGLDGHPVFVRVLGQYGVLRADPIDGQGGVIVQAELIPPDGDIDPPLWPTAGEVPA